jgi:hypothetical protein
MITLKKRERFSQNMNKRKILLTLFLTTVLFISSFVASKPAYAFSLGDVFDGIKNIFSPQPTQVKKELTITSKIELTPNGDINNNGKITSGDILKFTYTITNLTDTPYPLLILQTNLDTSILNNISNIQGAASVDENDKTISIPNINIAKNQIRTISFEAQINFNKNKDMSLSTEPKLVDQIGKDVATHQKQNVQILKMDEATFNQFVHITK